MFNMKSYRYKISIIISTFLIITIAFTSLRMTSNYTSTSKINKNYDWLTPNPSKSSASVIWPVNGTPIGLSSGHQGSPQLISDGDKGVIIVWGDGRNLTTGNDIYAQRLNSSGDPQWTANGVPICIELNTQFVPQLVSDGEGGAIIIWEDYRNPNDISLENSDLYAQKVNSSGDTQWTAGGVPISISRGFQGNSQLISDGAGGAIIIWRDGRDLTEYDIYAQRISSGGARQWALNGIPVLTIGSHSNNMGPQLISDGAGGAIIVWRDDRIFGDYDIFAQRISSGGTSQWATNGISISNAGSTQEHPQLISDGAGGAIIVWRDGRDGIPGKMDIYAQKVNSSGISQWTVNGVPICTLSGSQWSPQLISDGMGGALIAWRGNTKIYDVYTQKINSNGVSQWTINGIQISNISDTPEYSKAENLQLISDGKEGIIIVWSSYQNSSPSYKTFTQRVNSTGDIQWIVNGISISSASGSQNNPKLVTDGEEGAIIVWEDNRASPFLRDIYAQKVIEHTLPTSNHPSDIDAKNGDEIINWILSDDLGGGYYRVLANDSSGNFYIWQNWQPWINNTPLVIPINYTEIGSYNYTIEYYDLYNLFGKSDTVIVSNINGFPTSNHPGNIIISNNENVTIDWILYDDLGVGLYRVLVNDTSGNYYTWQEWQPWINNTILTIPINRTASGIFNYTIEYHDIFNLYGVSDTVVVIISEESQPVKISFGLNYLLPMLFSIILVSLKSKKKTKSKEII